MKEKKINPMGLLLKWADKDRKWIILSVVCGFISGILGIGVYIGIYRLMDALVSGSCNGQVVVDNAILITTTVILRHIFLGTSGVLSHKGAYGALFTVRCMVTEHLSKVPLGALNEKRTGDMKTVLNEDIEKLGGAEKAANMYRAKSITVFTKDRQGIYAQLKGDEVKVGDKIVTGGQQNLSNGALVSVADKAGVGTEQPANKTNL